MSDSSFETFARLFARLRSYKNSAKYSSDTLNRAPQKPLLLLSVLDLFGEGAIQDGRVPVGPVLAEAISSYWYRVMPPGNRPNMTLPFFHLQNDGGFWKLVSTAENERVLQQTSQMQTMSVLRGLVAYAQLDVQLVQCLAIPNQRAALRDVLIQSYFSAAAQARLLDQAEVNVEAYEYSNLILRRQFVAEAQLSGEYRAVARSQGFRRAVVTAYDYRCAMCGIRVVTLDGHAAVEAAHIHAWAVSKDDSPTNGLALCRLCHWTFDEGLLGADPDRTILVSPQLSTHSNVPGHLAQLLRRPLISPGSIELAANPVALSWHRRHVFRSR